MKSSREDGIRILVDRFWPRGMSKEKIGVSEWMRDIGPSQELIRWFGHDPKRWADFEKRYRKELASKRNLIQRLMQISDESDLTLVYSARDEFHNQAVVIKKILEEKR